jgi:hypothetical protein
MDVTVLIETEKEENWTEEEEESHIGLHLYYRVSKDKRT